MKKIILAASFFAAVMLMMPFTSTAGQADVSIFGEEKLKEESLVGAVAGMDICGQFMNLDQAELPEWSIGDFWEYDLTFCIDLTSVKLFSIELKNAEFLVNEINENDDEYVLGVSGFLNKLVYNNVVYSPDASYVTGIMRIQKSTLAMKDLTLNLLGNGKTISFDIVLSMNFNPAFDLLDFPINLNENPWDLSIDIDISVSGSIDFLGVHIPINTALDDNSLIDTLSVVEKNNNTCPAGTFESYLISGELTDVSEIWYSPEVGYFTDFNFYKSFVIGGLGFYLDLLSTNFNHPENNAPAIPDINGPTSGAAGEEYEYNVSTTDPNDDDVYYKIDWGDGTFSDWLGPNASGENVTISHTWSKEANYRIRVKAKDENGYQTAWSDPLPVTMPVNQPDGSQSSQQSGSPQSNQNQNSQQSVNSLLLRLLEGLMNQYSQAFPLLRNMLGR